MRRRLTLLGAASVLALAVAGCDVNADDNPCEWLMPAGKVIFPMQEEDGTRVEVDGRPAECQDGEAVPLPRGSR